jgi:hypothetical protein
MSSLPKLHTLVMINCREVDDAALLQLARNSSLKKVLLRGTKVTAAGIDAFRQRNAECEVDRDTR